jgi:alpha-L-arabinofuranosidase
LPVRRDVAEGFVEQGVTVLRYGGSMVNAPEYRWKQMIGPRDRRPPYRGTWYPYSSNGWGIIDFLDLCEAAEFAAIPDLNVNESPQDLADFVEYVNGPAESTWGAKRAAAGHPKPYGVKLIELGNEERVDEAYFEKFAKIAEAVWAKDPAVTLVVGDFAYNRPIADPMTVEGADSKITSLEAHRKILELAKRHDREVWFDVHVWTDRAEASASLKALASYIDAIDRLADGARHRVAVFELNANNHRQRRALGNALAIGMATRDGRLTVMTSANALQPDGQNDNGWDQGLLFLDPSRAWLQPPGYVTRMVARSYEPMTAAVEVSGGDGGLDVTALRSEDGKVVVLRVVNAGAAARRARIEIAHFATMKETAEVEELAGPAEAANDGGAARVTPVRKAWRHGAGKVSGDAYEFPAGSFTVMRFD